MNAAALKAAKDSRRQAGERSGAKLESYLHGCWRVSGHGTTWDEFRQAAIASRPTTYSNREGNA